MQLASGGVRKMGAASQRRGLGSWSFIYTWEVACVARGAQRGLSIPREQCNLWYHKVTQLYLPFFSSPKTLDSIHLRKIPFPSCSPFRFEPKMELIHRHHTKAQCGLSLYGGQRTPRFFKDSGVAEITPSTLEISSCFYNRLRWNLFLHKHKHSKQIVSFSC